MFTCVHVGIIECRGNVFNANAQVFGVDVANDAVP